MAISSYQYQHVDIWEEETFRDFKEVVLPSYAAPLDERIYVMYHGTTLKAAEKIIPNGFERSKDGLLGSGVYVCRDIDKAARYPFDDKRDQVILKLRVNVGKAMKVTEKHNPSKKTWHDHGYDMAWVPPYCCELESGLEEDCVWDPNRIKVVGIEKAPKKHLQYLQELVLKYRT